MQDLWIQRARSAALAMCLASTIALPATGQILPASFVDQRISVKPKLPDGRHVHFYTDTGGGFNAITEALVAQYGWPVETEAADGQTAKFTPMPDWVSDASIPTADLNNFLKGRLFVVPSETLNVTGTEALDGFLGGRWHAGKVISWHYPQETMTILSTAPVEDGRFRSAPATLQKTPDGQYTTAFPRVEISIQNETHSVLFDTGATAVISEAARKVLASETVTVGISYMSAPVFDAWHEDHPDWRYIADGDSVTGRTEPLIEVPNVIFAGLDVGPVWFARRQEGNFETFMSQFMDAPVIGAIGGSLFGRLHVVLDYPQETVYVRLADQDVTPQ